MTLLTLFAYIDPMSGAILLQVIIAGFVGCVAFFRRSIGRVFGRVFGRKQSEESTND